MRFLCQITMCTIGTIIRKVFIDLINCEDGIKTVDQIVANHGEKFVFRNVTQIDMPKTYEFLDSTELCCEVRDISKQRKGRIVTSGRDRSKKLWGGRKIFSSSGSCGRIQTIFA